MVGAEGRERGQKEPTCFYNKLAPLPTLIYSQGQGLSYIALNSQHYHDEDQFPTCEFGGHTQTIPSYTVELQNTANVRTWKSSKLSSALQHMSIIISEVACGVNYECVYMQSPMGTCAVPAGEQKTSHHFPQSSMDLN